MRWFSLQSFIQLKCYLIESWMITLDIWFLLLVKCSCTICCHSLINHNYSRWMNWRFEANWWPFLLFIKLWLEFLIGWQIDLHWKCRTLWWNLLWWNQFMFGRPNRLQNTCIIAMWLSETENGVAFKTLKHCASQVRMRKIWSTQRAALTTCDSFEKNAFD